MAAHTGRIVTVRDGRILKDEVDEPMGVCVRVDGIAMNRLRSGLTTLGILIGVGAVILLLAVGNGSALQVQQNIEQLGTNTLTVFSGGIGPGASSDTQSQDRASRSISPARSPRTREPRTSRASRPRYRSGTATYEGASHDIGTFVGTYPSYFEATTARCRRALTSPTPM